MIKLVVFAPLLVGLTTCAEQAVTPLVEKPVPSVVSPTSIPASTFLPLTYTPSPTPAGPMSPVITPDPNQVARWQEYEDALASTFFSSLTPEQVVCEWVILGQTEQEVYVWAHCASIYSAGPSEASIPTVIYLGADRSVLGAEIPGAGTAYAAGIRRMFPPDLQDIIFNRLSLPSQDQMDHLRWRRGHPDEPPWIILPWLPAQPTPTVMPMNTPDSAQVENWPAHEAALATAFSYLPPAQVICEWEVVGRRENEIYVWAVCGAIMDKRVGLEGLAVIYAGGPVPTALRSNDPAMYPSDVQERYFTGSIHFQELVDHLRSRQGHVLAEPPLIILNARTTP